MALRSRGGTWLSGMPNYNTTMRHGIKPRALFIPHTPFLPAQDGKSAAWSTLSACIPRLAAVLTRQRLLRPQNGALDGPDGRRQLGKHLSHKDEGLSAGGRICQRGPQR